MQGEKNEKNAAQRNKSINYENDGQKTYRHGDGKKETCVVNALEFSCCLYPTSSGHS